MTRRGTWTAKELMRPNSWSTLAAMLWWALNLLCVVEIAQFCISVVSATFFDKKLLWDREMVVLAISVVVVVCYHTVKGKKKEPDQSAQPPRPPGG